MIIRHANSLHGNILVPGDKSISHRAVMLASIADGVTKISNFAPGQDCRATVECMRLMGVKIEQVGDELTVHGVGRTGLVQPKRPLDCRNSGTTMRLLAGLLAGQAFDSTLVGDSSLHSRPMKRIIEPLTKMGAAIESNRGNAPLRIKGRALNAIEYTLPVASAQVKSCVLLAGLYADGTTIITEPNATRDHTERILGSLGFPLTIELHESSGKTIKLDSTGECAAGDINVPGDISSAAYFMVAASVLPGSEIVIKKVGLNPTRSSIVDVLTRTGANIEIPNSEIVSGEPVGDVVVRGGLTDRSPKEVLGGADIAGLIDEIPVLAVYGTQLVSGLEVRDARELRLKESDRIAAVVANLQRMGGKITERDEGFIVEHSKLHGAQIDPHGDHRIAMAFAVAGLFAEGETEIAGAECVDVSFPGFFDTLAKVVRYE